MRHQVRQAFALFPSRANAWVWIAEPRQGRVQKFIGRRSVLASPLPIERPAEYELCGTVIFGRHASEPMVDQRRLADTRPGHDGYDIDLRVCPGRLQEGEVLFSTKDLARGNGQSGQRDFLRSSAHWQLPSCAGGIGRRYLLQALTRDGAPSFNRARYRRQRLK